MIKSTPLVSILSPSFNHEQYISCFMDSLLAQSNPNWELIIVDDCSSDNNVAEIKKYSDSRIKLIEHTYNKGINAAINDAFSVSSGKYLSFFASDDALDEHYVEDIINTMEQNPNTGVVYYALQCMDNNSNIIENKFLHCIARDKYQALNKSFYQGNSLVSPGMCFRRELFEKIYPLNLALSQFQDYKLHIDLALLSDIYVSDKALVKYRIPSEKSGISFMSPRALVQTQLEENILMDSFLEIKDIKTLEDIFGDDLKPYGKISDDLIPYILGNLALNSPNQYKKIWGYNQISRFLSSQENYDKVNKLYGFCYKDFLHLADKFITNDSLTQYKKKYKKYKKLFKLMVLVTAFLLIGIIIMLIS